MPLLAMLLLSVATVNTHASDSTAISVQPAGVVDESLGPGESFSVDIVISDVTNLGGYDFWLNYSTSVLTTSSADVTVVTDWFNGPKGIKVWKKVVDDALGYVRLWVTLGMGTLVGVEGSGTVVTIKFTVDALGTTVLDLNNTFLGDPFAVPISHQTADGFFTNVPLPIQLWIKGKGAMGGGVYPEWHVNVPGAEQTLYARIVNTGDVGCYVKVEFSIYCPAVGRWSVVSSETWIDPKPIDESVIVSATFTETHTTGVYYVSGLLHFSLDGSLWIPYYLAQSSVGGEGISRDIGTKFKTLEQWTG